MAVFLDFERSLNELLVKKHFHEIYHFVHNRAFSARLDSILELPDTGSVKAINVLTCIDKMKKIREDAREEYDYLCEYAHPNAYGARLYFGIEDKINDVVVFSDAGPEPTDDLKWVLIAGHLLCSFEQALDRIEAGLSGLSDLARQCPEKLLFPADAHDRNGNGTT